MSDTEYIPRDAVDNVLLKLEDRVINNPFALIAMAMAIDKIDNIPAADVAPVVHGQWVMSTDRTYMPQCTNCGAHPFKGYIPSVEEVSRTYKFCPCCGAKMDESEDNENG